MLSTESILDIRTIILTLEAERDRLDKAISLLRGGGSNQRRRRRGPRRLSAVARKRISDAQKKRWAARKKNDAT